jgi:hypothetical protein
MGDVNLIFREPEKNAKLFLDAVQRGEVRDAVYVYRDLDGNIFWGRIGDDKVAAIGLVSLMACKVSDSFE